MATSNWQQVETDGSIMRLHVNAPEGAGCCQRDYRPTGNP